MKTKINIKRILSLMLIIIFSIGILYSAYNLIIWKKSVDTNKKINEKINEAITINEEEKNYIIDFETLKKQNPDTIAYLKVNNTNINYVVVRGKDNSYYLNHNFNRENNVAGWVFADYKNKFDGTDKNIIIYAHNTQDGSMFGTLKNIMTKNWQNNEENKIITLITEQGEAMYQVFSVYKIEAEDYYIRTEFTDKDFEYFVNKLKKRSVYDFKVEDSYNQVLTLSTCSETGKERVVLHAGLITPKE
ncbi:MAG: class B sortase [Bacilli bacterium]|nr:class B sortase [Bacilli bacterium]